MNKKNFYKNISLVLVVFITLNLFVPSAVLAQIRQNPTYVYGSDVDNDLLGGIEDAAMDCAKGALLNGLIGTATNMMKNYFESGATSITASAMSVPVNSEAANQITSGIREDTSSQVAKEIGGFAGVSLDSVAFCLVNKTIAGIVSGTTNWVSKGFGGNPAFINNPGRYFGNIAEYELGKILGELTDDLICININVNSIRNNLYRNYYGRIGLNIPRCALGTININVDAFSQGNFSDGGGWDAWLAYTSDPYSNYYGTQTAVNQELDNRIDRSQETAKMELDWNNGYQSIRDQEGNITTPGNMIQSQVEGRLNAPINRLSFADEFDEIMNQLIGQFLGVAIGD